MFVTDVISVQSALLCEGFRLEANNKLLIFGVYGGDVVVAEFPSLVQLAMYVEVKGIPKGEHLFELKLSAPGGELGVELNRQEFPDGEAAIPMPALPMNFVEEGSLIGSYRLDEGEWVEILNKKVVLGQI